MRFLLFLVLITQAFAGNGQLTKHQFNSSKIFPGTTRDYSIYVPVEYDKTKPACLMIFQDGAGFVANPGKEGYVPDAFDTLIASGEMPVTIGLFINPGFVPVPPLNGNKNAQPRFNRSFEYDGMGPNYAHFLIKEMRPLVGKNFSISTNPDDRALCGGSSGAIASFTAAWERPDQFRRVYSMIGTYVGLRGGNDYPTLIRKTEPKPLRIYKRKIKLTGAPAWQAPVKVPKPKL